MSQTLIPKAQLDATLVDTSTSQTLTNKTLTTPIISSISNSGTVTIPTGTDTLVNLAGTQTLTNKHVTPQVQSVTSSATVTPVSITNDLVVITAQAAGLTIAAPSGSPNQGDKLVIRIKDNGTARGITWNSIYRASSDLALPTTTVLSKTLYCGFMYNSTDTKWDLLALLNNF